MKRILTLVFVLSSLMAYAQPPNDSCSNATVIPLVNGAGSNFSVYANATPSPAGNWAQILPPCTPNGTANDVFFVFNAGNTFTDYEVTLTAGSAAAQVDFEIWRLVQVPNQNPCLNPALQAGVTCASGTGTATAIVTGLTANNDYYIRVWSNTAGFVMTADIKPYIPPTILDNATTGQTNNSCIGTLYDSGGPTNNYGALEDFNYTICPTDPHNCVELGITYQFEPFPAVDRLEIYSGTAVDPNNLYDVVCDQGSQTITVPDSCVTIRFRSDGTTNASGFEINWSCSNNCAPAPQPSDCYTATPIPSLPFSLSQESTCGAGNNYDASDACGSAFMSGEDYVYAYTSLGNECINVKLTNSGSNAGVFVMNGCPNADATQCLAKAEEQAGNPEINSVELADPGTYYIVVSSDNSGCAPCMGYNIIVQPAPCPLKVYTNITPDSMVNTIAAQGVVVENAVLDCPQGAFGVFEGGVGDGTSFMDGGIVLSNGQAIGAEGPSSIFSSSQLGSGGDSLLSVIAGQPTQDRCALEFDVFAPTDLLVFNYLFGSEEYNEWVGSGYNDAFAFLLSGPNITGQMNLAYLPNTTTPITINTVNATTNPAYYRNNTPADGPAANEEILGYDAHTTIIEAQATVTPCEWYHVKMIIADGTDQIYDSGVLIEANSLFGNIAAIASTGENSQFDNTINAAEGCANGAFIINLLAPQTTSNDTVYIEFAGDALLNIDYVINNNLNLIQQPDGTYMLVFPPGTISDTISITPILDGIIEDLETVTIYLSSTCPSPYDSATLIIRDFLNVSLPPTLTICGNPVEMPLVPNGADFTFWTPGYGLSDSTLTNPLVAPDTNTTYTVIASNGVCFDTLSIDVVPNLFEAFGDTVLCEGQSTQITSYTNITSGVSYSWSPTDGLSCTGCAEPSVSGAPVGVNNYVVTYNSPSCMATDTVTIEVLGQPSPNAGDDEIICEGESVSLGGAGETGIDYIWIDQNTGDTIATGANLDIIPTTTTTYELQATNGNCPPVSDVVTIGVEGNFDLTSVPSSNEIILGQTVDVATDATPLGINPIGNLTYTWTVAPATAVPTPTGEDPTLAPIETAIYTVTAESAAGCLSSASFEVVVNVPNFNVPNAFTPNGDGSNDAFKVLTAPGAIYNVLTFRVFNRWGNLVYNGDGVANASWNGEIDGQKAAQDTYIYHVIISLNDGTEQEFRGEVLLVR